jgi:hypothetical protein
MVFFSIGGGGSEISGIPPSQVYLNGTVLSSDDSWAFDFIWNLENQVDLNGTAFT